MRSEDGIRAWVSIKNMEPIREETGLTWVVTQDTPYFIHGGRMSERPPDGVLRAGMKVELLEVRGDKEGLVRTEGGSIRTWIGTAHLKPL